jgi:uncharacterized protein (TIGR01319 family)
MSSKFSRILVTDCGSTTTKAILFEKLEGGWKSSIRGEAPTTVERPLADVTIGVRNSFKEVEELWNKPLITNDQENCPLRIRINSSDDGVDLYLSTSSAGGGLQMIVLGVVGDITAKSAARAALGGGAIVLETIALDNKRLEHESIKKIRHLRPDIVLIAGGIEGGTLTHPLELAQLLLSADPRPRFGDTLKIPVIYAGNSAAAPEVKKLLEGKFSVSVVENLKPTLDTERLTPARDSIHEIFLSHVMSHAPGYAKLLKWTPKDILPTPVAFGDMISTISNTLNLSVLAVDIGGATTDVFSCLPTVANQKTTYNLHRTVSANLGMSYSIANVLVESGAENILRWIPFSLPKSELEDILRNKMIRPTSIPETYNELLIEQAVCREALRLSLIQHRNLLPEDSGAKKPKGIDNLFKDPEDPNKEKLQRVELIIGSGGVLSHAPNRKSAALMLIDAFEPLGVTKLAVDSVFMLPHLGVLSSVDKEAALEVLMRDCLIPLGTCISISGFKETKLPKVVASLKVGSQRYKVIGGEFTVVPLESEVDVQLLPETNSIDVGAGPGRALNLKLQPEGAGLIIDARGRPLKNLAVKNCFKALGLDELRT